MGLKLRRLLGIRRSREERSSGGMVLTVTEDTPADMLAGSMELLVQLPKDHNVHTQRVTVPRSTPMMDLLVQIATAHKLAASSYTLQAIGERGLVLPHQPNTPIGALDALQVKLLPKQGTLLPRKAKQANQPFETTFRLQVLLPRNQLYVSRVSPKMNLGKILDEVCREKNLDKNKYELRHPANLEETLDLSLSLQDYHLQEVTLYAKQGRTLGAALSSQDIMALQRQEERRRQQAKQSVFGFMFRKSKESSLSIDSLGGRSVSPARSDETGRSVSPLAPPARPQRKRRPAPKPPVQTSVSVGDENSDESKDKLVISHSRNSSDSSGYHEASVLSDNPDSGARMPETLPRRSKAPCKMETSRKLAQTSESSKSLGNLAMASGGLSHGISSTSISSTGIRKKRAAPPPPIARPLSSAISTQALERIVDSEESLTSDIDISKSPSDIAASSKANSDIGVNSKANSDIGVHSFDSKQSSEIGYKIDSEFRAALAGHEDKIPDIERRSAPEPPPARLKPSLDLSIGIAKTERKIAASVEEPTKVEIARVVKKANGDRPTETDILLQKVSDTLSSTLPLAESPVPVVAMKISRESEDIATPPREKTEKHTSAKDESDGVPETIENSKKTNEDTKKLIKQQTETKNRESLLLAERNLVNADTPNATIDSQQDTSDYVSATGDDLSITDWEYQLPAPPSAFRDNVSPDFDGYDTITLRSVDAFKEPVAPVVESQEHEEINVATPARESPLPPPVAKEIKEIAKPPTIRNAESSHTEKTVLRASQPTKPKLSPQTSSESRVSDASIELKKEIISELATKIENGSLPQSNNRVAEHDSRRSSDDFAAPKIAPVDNTLSNFTITTYSRQKSLNIFEEETVEPRRSVPEFKNNDERVERTFATLARNKSSMHNNNGNFGSRNALNRGENEGSSEEKQTAITRAQSVEHIVASEMEFKKPEAKNHFNKHDSLLRRPSLSNGHEKSTPVHRSKSYITLANNSKYREETNGEKRDVDSRNDIDDCRIVKSTSVTNLNQETPRQNEKFSQWRDNILKRQEEPSKEKQLQSLQVLKSILPQLKSTQQTEENVVDSSNKKENSREKRSETLPEDEKIESKSSATEAKTEADVKPQKAVEETTTKRYKYTGPPAINLGSWSERPRVNVQLKMDTDYKFGTNNTSGAKTVVNLNGTSGDGNDETQSKDNSATKTLPKNFAKNSNGTTVSHNETLRLQRRESEDELAKKLITHTTASGFKKPIFNKVGLPEVKNFSRTEEKPIVTSVALKKTHIERSDSRIDEQQRDVDDEKIDTKPVSFKELTKTFGQEVCLRTNPKRVLQNRHSDYYGTRTEIPQNGQSNFLDNEVKNTRNFGVANGVPRDTSRGPIRRYTSVVGIQSQNNNNYGTENGEPIIRNHTTTMKMNGLMPVVKGFKIQVGQSETKTNGVSANDTTKKNPNVPPPPPTMPIITGVTLKNTTNRPKSMPVCNADPRDHLLESIRNFGGRDKLKNVNTFA